MDSIPLSAELAGYVDELNARPRPRRPRREPKFLPLREALPRWLPGPGELLLVTGPAPIVQMVTSGAIVHGFGHARVALDLETYAGPTADSLITALSGVRDHESPWERGAVLEAATQLAAMDVSLLSSDSLLARLEPRFDVAVIEADRFEGGLDRLASEARRTGTAVLVPHDDTEERPAGRWPELRLVEQPGAYASGQTHVTARLGDERLRLAFASGSGRFL